MKKVIGICVSIFSITLLYYLLFYPKQILPISKSVQVFTPQPEKYNNDCLHPCIRIDTIRHCYWMVHSPYYLWDSATENPILYRSYDLALWREGVIVTDTPSKGFNSDPNIYLQKDTVFVFWREFNTPLCDSLAANCITVGCYTTNGIDFSEKKIYLVNSYLNGDNEQAPTLIKWKEKYRFYATWYKYSPSRKNMGIAIWEGTSLSEPNFHLIDTVAFKPAITRDKYVQKRVSRKLLFIPKPHKYDLWHFDLVEYGKNLIMVSSSEKGDNIMLSKSDDGVHFKTKRTPLINNHYMENFTGYRQYYYKPTAIIENDSLIVFYTTNDKEWHNNVLQKAAINLDLL